MSHFLYAIGPARARGDEPQLIKIGHTNNIERRLIALQVGCPIALTLKKSWRFARRASVIDLEKHCHARFIAERKHGEWFDVTLEVVSEFVDQHSAHRGKHYSITMDEFLMRA
ncbi:MAG: GIY-YIG nuclease family protein [Brucella anthropi]